MTGTSAQLTDEMRDYIRAQAQTDVLLFDFVKEFRSRFHLEPEEMGRLLAQWTREVD